MFGPRCSAADVAAKLDAHEVAIVHGVDDPAAFQDLLDRDRILYLSRGPLTQRDLDQLLTPRNTLQYLDAPQLRRIALAQSVSELTDALRAAIVRATDAEHARCVLFDAGRQVLWAPNESDGDSAAVGLVSFALRSGVSLCVARAGDDPRFDADLDGDAANRFLAVPVNGVAVLVATRTTQPFEPAELAALEAIAAHAAPYLSAWVFDAEDADGPFRRRALRELEQPLLSGPEPLRLDSVWTRAATWFVPATLVVIAIAVALFFAEVRP